MGHRTIRFGGLRAVELTGSVPSRERSNPIGERPTAGPEKLEQNRRRLEDRLFQELADFFFSQNAFVDEEMDQCG